MAFGLTQRELAERSGVKIDSLRRFERTGRASLEAVVKLALVLDALDGFESLFPESGFRSIAEVVAAPKRRMVFNVLAHNRDDHGKQFSFLMDASGEWRLAPAYDLTFSAGPGGEHATLIAGEGRRPDTADMMKLAPSTGLGEREARAIGTKSATRSGAGAPLPTRRASREPRASASAG